MTLRNNWGDRLNKKISRKKTQPKVAKEQSISDAAQSYGVQHVKIANIQVGANRRALNGASVKDLMESISVLGLREPITVRLVKRQIKWGKHKLRYILVDGLHRLEAMKGAGKTTIPARVMSADQRVVRMWEISANIHRADMTPVERAEAIVEWRRLVKELLKDGQIAHPGGKQPKDKGISKTARELGVSREVVRRAVEIDSISATAKAAAKELGLDKNESALREVAKQPDAKAQVLKVKELAAQTHSRSKRVGKWESQALAAEDKRDLEDLIGQWNDTELKHSFIEATPKASNQFIEHMRKDRSLALKESKAPR